MNVIFPPGAGRRDTNVTVNAGQLEKRPVVDVSSELASANGFCW